MIYLLDTNICIRYLNKKIDFVIERFKAVPTQDIAVCSIIKAELFHGARKSQNPNRTLAQQQAFLAQFTSLPFDDRAAEVYGYEKARLETLGTPIGPNDLLIASIAVAHNLTLVTHNTREFGRITGLKLDDWEVTL